MATRHNFYCDCGDPTCSASAESKTAINDHELPIVLYLVAGDVSGAAGREIDLNGLDPVTRAVITSPRQRVELHPECVAGWLERVRTAPWPPSEPASENPVARAASGA